MARTSSLQFSPFAAVSAPLYIVSFSANTWVAKTANSLYTFADMAVSDTDGSVYATGFIEEGGVSRKKMFMLKMDANSVVQWAYTTTATANNLFFYPTGLSVSPDGSRVCCGYVVSNTSTTASSTGGYFTLHSANGALAQSTPVRIRGTSVSFQYQLGEVGPVSGITTLYGSSIAKDTIAIANTTRAYAFGFSVSPSGYNQGTISAFDPASNSFVYSTTQGGALSPAQNYRSAGGWVHSNGNVYVAIDSQNSGTSRGAQIWSYNSGGTLSFQRTFIRTGATVINCAVLPMSISGQGANVFVGGAMSSNNTRTLFQDSNGTIWSAQSSNGEVKWVVRYEGTDGMQSLSAGTDNYLYYLDLYTVFGRVHVANGAIDWGSRKLMHIGRSNNGQKIVYKNGKLYICTDSLIIATAPDGSELPIGTSIPLGDTTVSVVAISTSNARTISSTSNATSFVSNTTTILTNNDIYTVTSNTSIPPIVRTKIS